MDQFWDDAPTWIGVAAAVAAFVVGLWQYRTAQQWKRAEFVAAEMKAFFADAQVATALILIDYSEIKLDPSGRISKTGRRFDDAMVISALAVHTKFAGEIEKFGEEEMQARLAFDALLTGLERFDHYVRAGLIEIDDLKVYLDYWIDKMGNPAKGWKAAAFYDALADFVNGYGYSGVAHLFLAFQAPLAARLKDPAVGLETAQDL